MVENGQEQNCIVEHYLNKSKPRKDDIEKVKVSADSPEKALDLFKKAKEEVK